MDGRYQTGAEQYKSLDMKLPRNGFSYSKFIIYNKLIIDTRADDKEGNSISQLANICNLLLCLYIHLCSFSSRLMTLLGQYGLMIRRHVFGAFFWSDLAPLPAFRLPDTPAH